jgi:hypothetical protein
MAGPLVSFELLGTLKIVLPDGSTQERFRTQKSALLLARLALDPRRQWSREELGEWLWPGKSPEAQRSRLRYELSVLRSSVPLDFIQNIGNSHLVLIKGAESDVALLRRAVEKQHFDEAVRLYSSDFLPGFYEDWVVQEREHLRQLAHDAHLSGVRAAEREGRGEDAHRLYQLWKHRFPHSEVSITVAPPLTQLETLASPVALSQPTSLLPAYSPPPLPHKRPSRLVVLLSFLTLAGSAALAPTAYRHYLPLEQSLFPRESLAAQFSTTSSTFGNWSLGVVDKKTAAFSPMTTVFCPEKGRTPTSWIHEGPLQRRTGDINKNLTGHVLNFSEAQWAPGEVAFHPSSGDSESPLPCIRWTAPVSKTYQVEAYFSGISTHPGRGATANLQARLNGKQVWGGTIRGSVVRWVFNGTNPHTSYDASMVLRPGDTLDFVIDDAGEWNCDQVGVSLTISGSGVYAQRLHLRQYCLAGTVCLGALFAGFWFMAQRRKRAAAS